MSETAKLQQYKYSLRSTVIAPRTVPNGYLCNNRFIVYPVPPDNAITIENLYLHLIVKFASGVASGSRKISKIGIGNNYPLFYRDPPRFRSYDMTALVADPTTRIIDTRIDLSALLKKDDVKWRDFFSINDPADLGYTYIIIDLPVELIAGSNGDLILCKMDALYTTKGIQ